MKTNEVFNYLIMEEAPAVTYKPTITNIVDKQNLFYVEFDATLQDFNARNRNKNRYKGDLMVKAFQAEHILELLAKKSMCCEAGHPLNVSTERAMTIDPKNVCCTILKFDVDTNYCKGHIQTIDDAGGVGTKMTKMMLQGMEPAFSLRTLANMRVSADGVRDLVSPPHIVCYDWVFVPSHKKAYMDDNKPVNIVDHNPYTGQQNTTTLIKPVTESDMSAISNMVAMESANLNMISNIYEVATNGLIMTDDYKYAVIKEEGRTFYVELESTIRKDINSFLAKM